MLPRGSVVLDAYFRSDIEAVLATLGINRVAICAMGPSAPLACHFATEAPDRVTRMVFVHGGTSEANRKLLALRSSSRDVEARLRGVAIGGVAFLTIGGDVVRRTTVSSGIVC